MDEPTAFTEFNTLLAGDLPELGPGPRAGVWPLKTIDAEFAKTSAAYKFPDRARNLLRGLVLLWHDHHEPAHAIAQDDSSADGSLLHAILHRREPDFSNAGYWFRRVGNHPCFPNLAKRVAEMPGSNHEKALLARLVRNGQWDSLAFIRECEEAIALPPSDPRVQSLRQIQAIESEVLLEHLTRD